MDRLLSSRVSAIACIWTLAVAVSGCNGKSSTPDVMADGQPSDAAADALTDRTGPQDVPADSTSDTPTPQDVAESDARGPDVGPDVLPDVPTDVDAVGSPDGVSDQDSADSSDTGIPPEEVLDETAPGEVTPDVEDDNQDITPPPAPELYTPGEGCALPAEYVFPGCEGVQCAEGRECMGNGVCVPSAPFMLQSEISASQVKPALWANPDGTFALAWYEVPEGGATWMDIYFQLFKPDATPKTDPVKVDQDELKWARSPSLTGLPGGKYLVLWRSQDGMSGGVAYHGRVLSSDGVPEGGSFQLNTTALEMELGSVSNVDGPFAELLRDEQAAVAWSGEPQGQQGQVNGYSRLFSSVGTPKSDELDLGGATEQDEGSAAVAPMPDSGMMAVWQTGPKLKEYRVVATTLNTGGKVVIPSTQVSSATDYFEGTPAAATFDEGFALVTWKARDQAFTGPTKTRMALRDLATLGDQGAWDVGFDPNGSYPFYAPVRTGPWGRALVAWHSCDSLAGPFVRRFYLDKKWLDCEPTNLGGPPLETEQICRYMPAIVAFEDGRFLVAWNTHLPDPGLDRTRIMLRFVR